MMKPETQDRNTVWPPPPSTQPTVDMAPRNRHRSGAPALGLAASCWVFLIAGLLPTSRPSPLPIRQTTAVMVIGVIMIILGFGSGIAGLIAGLRAFKSLAGKAAIALTVLPVAVAVVLAVILIGEGLTRR